MTTLTAAPQPPSREGRRLPCLGCRRPTPLADLAPVALDPLFGDLVDLDAPNAPGAVGGRVPVALCRSCVRRAAWAADHYGFGFEVYGLAGDLGT